MARLKTPPGVDPKFAQTLVDQEGVDQIEDNYTQADDWEQRPLEIHSAVDFGLWRKGQPYASRIPGADRFAAYRERRDYRARLRGLGPPLLVIPGNHDIPTFPPARVVKPWHEFERLWETTQPAHSTPTD